MSRIVLLLVATLCLSPLSVRAETSTTATTAVTATIAPAASDVAKEPKPVAPPGFEPIAGKQDRAESVDADVLVAASYGSIFVLLLGYLVAMLRDRKRIDSELAALSSQIASAESES